MFKKFESHEYKTNIKIIMSTPEKKVNKKAKKIRAYIALSLVIIALVSFRLAVVS